MQNQAFANSTQKASSKIEQEQAETSKNQTSADSLTFLGYNATFVPPNIPLKDFFDFQRNKWQEIQEKYTPDWYAIETTPMEMKNTQKWRALLNHLKKVPKIEILKGINDFMNKIPAGVDQKLYGEEEYWARPDEFFRKWAGDCEDYAFAKYYALQYLDWPTETLWILLIYHKEHKNFHVVLAVDFQGKRYILDNLTKPTHILIEEDKYKAQALPLAVLSSQGYWIFKEGVGEFVEKYAPQVEAN